MSTLETVLGQGPYFNGSGFSLVDAAFAPVFRYFDVIDLYADFGIFAATPRVRAWRDALSERPSVQQAVVKDYSQRLHKFLIARNSFLSECISSKKVA
jgi:glutathione S-transferase